MDFGEQKIQLWEIGDIRKKDFELEEQEDLDRGAKGMGTLPARQTPPLQPKEGMH